MAAGGKIHVDGYSFRNERELQVYWGLRSMVKDGRVLRLEILPKIALIVNEVHLTHYQPSFTLYDVLKKQERTIQVINSTSHPLRDLKEALYTALTGIKVEHWA